VEEEEAVAASAGDGLGYGTEGAVDRVFVPEVVGPSESFGRGRRAEIEGKS